MILGNYIQLGLRMKCTTKVLKKWKKTSPPHFFAWNTSVYRGFREGGVSQTGHSTPHLTPPSFIISVSRLYLLSAIDCLLKIEHQKSDLLREVLSDLFKKHLPIGIASKQRGFGMVKWGGEVFFQFCFFWKMDASDRSMRCH